MGQVSYYIDEDTKKDFDDEYPSQQLYTPLQGETEITIDAKADDGWKFVKWTTAKGKDYSDTSKVTLTVKDKTELVAIFESEE